MLTAGSSHDLGLCRRGAVDYSSDPQCISSLGSADSAYSSHDMEAALAYIAAERPQREWQARMPAGLTQHARACHGMAGSL